MDMDAYPDSLLRNLPPLLTDLYNTDNCISQIPTIPPTIQNMMIKLRPASETSSESSICDVQRLPRILKELYMIGSSDDAKFGLFDFECLPSNLSILTISLHHIASTKALSALPQTLKSLTIVAEGTETPLTSDPTLLDYLPSKSLTTLMIIVDVECSALSLWISSLSRFTSLKELDISVWDFSPSSELPYDYSSLPPSLTELKMPLCGGSLLPEHIEALPKGLTSLGFGTVDDLVTTASDDCFEHLPSSLIELGLPSLLQGLTSEVFSILPSTINLLYLPDNIVRDVHLFYAREPEWVGYQPLEESHM
jgi:hypothetical protein